MAELKLRFQRFAFRFFFVLTSLTTFCLILRKNVMEKVAQTINTQQKLWSEKSRFFVSESITLDQSMIGEIRVKKQYGRQTSLQWIQLKSHAYIFSKLWEYTCFCNDDNQLWNENTFNFKYGTFVNKQIVKIQHHLLPEGDTHLCDILE